MKTKKETSYKVSFYETWYDAHDDTNNGFNENVHNDIEQKTIPKLAKEISEQLLSPEECDENKIYWKSVHTEACEFEDTPEHYSRLQCSLEKEVLHWKDGKLVKIVTTFPNADKLFKRVLSYKKAS